MAMEKANVLVVSKNDFPSLWRFSLEEAEEKWDDADLEVHYLTKELKKLRRKRVNRDEEAIKSFTERLKEAENVLRECEKVLEWFDTSEKK
jgi:tRNA A-37 threonylcarbamoyl transferase component Bud32